MITLLLLMFLCSSRTIQKLTLTFFLGVTFLIEKEEKEFF
jgi:hypothetical protein